MTDQMVFIGAFVAALFGEGLIALVVLFGIEAELREINRKLSK